jgi:hypothetical protein
MAENAWRLDELWDQWLDKKKRQLISNFTPKQRENCYGS